MALIVAAALLLAFLSSDPFFFITEEKWGKTFYLEACFGSPPSIFYQCDAPNLSRTRHFIKTICCPVFSEDNSLSFRTTCVNATPVRANNRRFSGFWARLTTEWLKGSACHFWSTTAKTGEEDRWCVHMCECVLSCGLVKLISGGCSLWNQRWTRCTSKRWFPPFYIFTFACYETNSHFKITGKTCNQSDEQSMWCRQCNTQPTARPTWDKQLQLAKMARAGKVNDGSGCSRLYSRVKIVSHHPTIHYSAKS